MSIYSVTIIDAAYTIFWLYASEPFKTLWSDQSVLKGSEA